jgi:hypothetical protein
MGVRSLLDMMKFSGRNAHELTMPSSVIPTTTGTPATSSFVAHHRVRPMDWVNPNTCVPCSISRANTGAPANIPSSTGNGSITMGR